MNKEHWIYIVITMCAESNEPLVRFVSRDEQKAHAFMQSVEDENPMFYIQELE